MDGALMEIGPYRLKDNETLVYNEGSWDEFANLLFVDQPVGTGFSYVNTDSYLHELDEMSAQFVVFLEEWFRLFPEYERDDVGSNPPTIPRHCSLMGLVLTVPADLYCWRVLRRSTYSIHRQSYSRTEQECPGQDHCSMELTGPPDRQWLDISN